MNSEKVQTPVETIDVFLVDRDKIFRRGLRAVLAQYPQIEIVGESDADPDVFYQIRALAPKVVLIDIHTPTFSGIELTRQIAQELPGVCTIVLTPYFNDDELVQSTIAGAGAYLSKGIEPSELATIIARTACGELLVVEPLQSNPAVLERVLKYCQDLLLKGRAVDSKDGRITEREAEVLSYVGCGYGNKQIASTLGISEQTIKNHMTSIMNKLGANDRAHAVVLAMQYGCIATLRPKRNQESPLY